ncbi:MAG TPA: pantoate--beta-alanine ligase [Chthoniobacterales bacterium]|nr:pantoate--beta-alanine ligase [Chthoniobacterales bacterium]
MRVIESTQSVQAHVRERETKSVLVPTMGALHRGHLKLIRVARERTRGDGEVAVSIFVNPLQFEPGSDFKKYPRPEPADEKLCEEAGVNVLFRPRDMYFDDRSVYVEETFLSAGLCGAARPGHFRGVCTVVAKLFNLLAPDAAVFGEKDYQQLAIVRRMVRDLNFPIEIIGVPTVREPDGLALSSRNQYLNPDERTEATVLHRAMTRVKELADGGQKSVRELIDVAEDLIASAKSARIDYISIVDADDLQHLEALRPNAVIALAVFIGKTRLIDNLRLT